MKLLQSHKTTRKKNNNRIQMATMNKIVRNISKSILQQIQHNNQRARRSTPIARSEAANVRRQCAQDPSTEMKSELSERENWKIEVNLGVGPLLYVE